MDENDVRESSNRVVVAKDSTAATAIAPTTATIVNKAVAKSDPMIIPTSSPVVNGDASPSPSKRMRYELIISTPKSDDRKAKFLSSPNCLIGQNFLEKSSDDERDGFKEDDDFDENCDLGLKEKRKDGDDQSVKAGIVIERDGFRLLQDAREGFGELKSLCEKKGRTFLSPQRDQSLQQLGVDKLQIKAMLPEKYSKPISIGQVLVAQIFDRTKSAIFLQAICQGFRLPENFSHLKRVKSEKQCSDVGKPEVVLHVIVRDVPDAEIPFDNDEHELSSFAQRYFADSLSALQSDSASPDDLSLHLDAIGSPYLARVSASPPLTRSQYEASRALWPCTFHEDKRITSLIDGRYFSPSESEVIRRNLALSLRVADEAKAMFGTQGDCDACVIVDPREGEVIAVAHDLSQFEEDARFGYRVCDKDAVTLSELSSSLSTSSVDDYDNVFKIRPYYHAPMVAIDLVAVSQGGGAYSIPLEKFPIMTCSSSSSIGNSASTTSIVQEASLKEDEDSNASGSVTYLCTGYDVYLSKEPCLMCAMSLIHSRIRRLFYRHKTSDGALGSRFSIHTLESLNHHFEAFCLE